MPYRISDAMGHRLSFFKMFHQELSAYDLMVIQKYEVQNGNWYIQNVGIEQAETEIPLDIDKTEDWF